MFGPGIRYGWLFALCSPSHTLGEDGTHLAGTRDQERLGDSGKLMALAAYGELLAEPFRAATRDRLNEIKGREEYRPVAPCARVEDLARAFHEDFEDPHMLYFRRVRDRRLEGSLNLSGRGFINRMSDLAVADTRHCAQSWI